MVFSSVRDCSQSSAFFLLYAGQSACDTRGPKILYQTVRPQLADICLHTFPMLLALEVCRRIRISACCGSLWGKQLAWYTPAFNLHAPLVPVAISCFDDTWALDPALAVNRLIVLPFAGEAGAGAWLNAEARDKRNVRCRGHII